MQKFTRPITREIEVAGERLAVTLSAEGVAVRPVGSRKPPHEMSWADLVAWLTESGAGDLAAAVAALKKGGPARPSAQAAAPSPAAPPAAPSGPAAGPDMKQILGRLEPWLAKHRRHFLEALLPGAAPADLDALQNRLGIPLPASLRALLAWHNGQSTDSIARFEQDWSLMSAEQIAAAKQALDGSGGDPAQGWQPAWIPFLDNDAGDYLCLDAGQPGAPVRAFWLGKAEHPVVAPSLEAWLNDVVAAMERGEYHEDPERGSFLRR